MAAPVAFEFRTQLGSALNARKGPDMTTPRKNEHIAEQTDVARTSPAPMIVKWLDTAQKHDYPAAASYLALLAGPATVRALVAGLKSSGVAHYKAKDILRASGLPLLPRDDVHVAKDLAQILAGQTLSPCLMIRGNARKWHLAQIADGYHRVCASYYTDEDTDIPVKIVKL